ncbi:MAG: hypothetical protein AB7T27_08945 [Kiritimatiellia bacterium]
MRALKILLAFVQWFLIALGIAWIVYVPFSEGSYGSLMKFYGAQYIALLLILMLAALLLMPGKIRLHRNKEPLEFIPLNGPNGDIRVSVRVAKNTVQECSAKFKAVKSLEPELSWGPDGLSVIMRLELERGQPLTTLCADLQSAVRERFSRELGIEQLREVRADIVDLTGAASGSVDRPAQEPQSESKPEQGS